jgi:hypothetical protein
MAELSEQCCLEDHTLDVPEGEKPTPVRTCLPRCHGPPLLSCGYGWS